MSDADLSFRLLLPCPGRQPTPLVSAQRPSHPEATQRAPNACSRPPMRCHGRHSPPPIPILARPPTIKLVTNTRSISGLLVGWRVGLVSGLLPADALPYSPTPLNHPIHTAVGPIRRGAAWQPGMSLQRLPPPPAHAARGGPEPVNRAGGSLSLPDFGGRRAADTAKLVPKLVQSGSSLAIAAFSGEYARSPMPATATTTLLPATASQMTVGKCRPPSRAVSWVSSRSRHSAVTPVFSR